MSNQRNEVVEHYLERVRKAAYKLASIELYIAQLRQDINDYMDSNPGATESELEELFGNPEEISKDFLEAEHAITPKSIARSRLIRAIIIVLLIIAVIVIGYYAIDYYDNINGYGELTISLNQNTNLKG